MKVFLVTISTILFILDAFSYSLALDIDKKMPKGNVKNNNTYVCLIAKDGFSDWDDGCNGWNDSIEKDCDLFRKCCERTLRIPSNHIVYYDNASMADMVKCTDYLKNASDERNGDINIILYVSGFGYRDTDDVYLRLSDRSDNCYLGLMWLYESIASIKARQSICFVDVPREYHYICDQMALIKNDTADGQTKKNHPVYIKAKEDVTKCQRNNNLIVFISTGVQEDSHDYRLQGGFARLMINKIQETKGNLTLGELYESISILMKFEPPQTPTVVTYPDKNYNWKDLKLCNQ